jgi:hypothetical protein
LVCPDGSLLDSAFIPLGWGRRDYYRSPAPAPAHWNTVRHLSLVARYFAGRDPAYARQCQEVACRVWSYMTRPGRPAERYRAPATPPLGHDGMNSWFAGFYPGSALDLGHRLAAAVELYRTTGEGGLLEDACRTADELVALQVGFGHEGGEPGDACFWEGPASDYLAESYSGHTSGLLGLCDLLDLAPGHPRAGRWRACLERVALQHAWSAARNPWGRVPGCWTSSAGNPVDAAFSFSAEGARPEGQYSGGRLAARATAPEHTCVLDYYPSLYNQEITGAALFLLRAARLLGEPAYRGIAQRQLDWVVGCNPFDVSSVEGVGYNQPHRGLFGEFFPPTPQIPGAVSVGISKKSISPQAYGLDNEYDMPPTGQVLWLMAELSAGEGSQSA